MKTTRLGILLVGTLACGLGAGCTASTGDGDEDPPVAGNGGTGNLGGSSNGGAGRGGSTGGNPDAGTQPGGQAGNTGRAGANGQAGSSGGAGAPGAGGAAGQGNQGGGPGTGRRDGGVTGVDAAPVGNGRDAAPTGGGADAAVAGGEKFSFFYTSLEAMQKLSGSEKGFGGDLRYGEPTGLQGADKICQEIAAGVGAGHKTWRAFLSVTKGPDGKQVDAIDRIGAGPWYDRRGRLIAMNVAGLIAGDRPAGDKAAVDDLPDESGLSTRRYDGKDTADTHDALTGSNEKGRLMRPGDLTATCNDWTNSTIKAEVMAGHSWPAFSGRGWSRSHTVHSCAPGVNININNGMGDRSSVGAGGGWGGFYCFATTP